MVIRSGEAKPVPLTRSSAGQIAFASSSSWQRRRHEAPCLDRGEDRRTRAEFRGGEPGESSANLYDRRIQSAIEIPGQKMQRRAEFLFASAGSKPAGYVHPLAIRAMQEIGIDIS